MPECFNGKMVLSRSGGKKEKAPGDDLSEGLWIARRHRRDREVALSLNRLEQALARANRKTGRRRVGLPLRR